MITIKKKDKTISNPGMYIVVIDSSYTDETVFKSAMQGVYLYYGLTEEILIKVDGNEAVTKLNNNLKSMKTMGEIELSCFEYFINNIYPTLAVDTTNIISGVFVNNQYVAYIGSKPDANFASFLFIGYGIRVMHVTNSGGNWTANILNN